MLNTNAKSRLAAALPALGLMLAAAHAPAHAAPASNAAAGTLVSLDEIERRATAEGLQVRDIELRDLLVEVKGRDANGKKVELVIDRRSGEVLSREEKAPKAEKTVMKHD